MYIIIFIEILSPKTLSQDKTSVVFGHYLQHYPHGILKGKFHSRLLTYVLIKNVNLLNGCFYLLTGSQFTYILAISK